MTGYCDPPKEHQFQPGNTAGLGKTSEQKRREMRNAEMATLMRERMLEAEIAKMTADPAYVPNIDANYLKLVKDSEDRGLGAPKVTQEIEASVGVTQITRRIVGEKT